MRPAACDSFHTMLRHFGQANYCGWSQLQSLSLWFFCLALRLLFFYIEPMQLAPLVWILSSHTHRMAWEEAPEGHASALVDAMAKNIMFSLFSHSSSFLPFICFSVAFSQFNVLFQTTFESEIVSLCQHDEGILYLQLSSDIKEERRIHKAIILTQELGWMKWLP